MTMKLSRNFPCYHASLRPKTREMEGHESSTLARPASSEWKDTYANLHMWTKSSAKVRLALLCPNKPWWVFW